VGSVEGKPLWVVSAVGWWDLAAKEERARSRRFEKPPHVCLQEGSLELKDEAPRVGQGGRSFLRSFFEKICGR
jgi:hypothetical protein